MIKIIIAITIINLVSCEAGDKKKTPPSSQKENLKFTKVEKCLEQKFNFSKNPEITGEEFNKILETSKLNCEEKLEDLETYFSKFNNSNRILDEIRILNERTYLEQK